MELKQVFETRRSINFFDPNRKVEDSLLKDIINLATLAPSAFNLQPWQIIAVKSMEAKEKLQKLANNQTKITEAPITLIILGDKNGFDKSNPVWEQTLKAFGGNTEAIEGMQNAAAYLYGSSEERRIKFAESNAGLIAMSIMYAAKSLGVDSHPMSGMDFEGIMKEFKFDENKTVVMAICLGYFAENKTLYPRAYRKSFEEIVIEV
jgi:putative NAD(P)H nitroreductase